MKNNQKSWKVIDILKTTQLEDDLEIIQSNEDDELVLIAKDEVETLEAERSKLRTVKISTNS